MKICLFVIHFIFIFEVCFAFSNNDDSSIKSINYLKKQYSDYKNQNKSDSVLHYATLLIDIYKKDKNSYEALELYHQTCEYFIEKTQYKLVVNILKQYVEYAEQLNNNNYKAKAYFLTGNLFMEGRINFETAVDYYNKSLEIYSNSNNESELALVCEKLGNCYAYHINNNEKALKYYLKSAEIRKENGFYQSLILTYHYLALLYRNNFSDYNTSKEYYDKALKLAIENNDSLRITETLVEKGCLDMDYHISDSVLVYFFKALEIADRIQDSGALDYCYAHLRKYYFINEDYEKALSYSLKMNNDFFIGQEKGIAMLPYWNAEMYMRLENYEDAAKYYKKYIHQKDSLIEIKKVNDISELELKFEMEKTENKNRLKEEKAKALRNTLIIFSVSLVIILFLIYRNYSNKQKSVKKLLEANQKLHEADKMKIRFFTNISHELRTPLTLLISPLERFRKRIHGTDEKELVDTMLKNGQKLKNLINQILDISKIDSHNLTLENGYHDFIQIFKTTASMFSSLAEEKNIDYQVFTDVKELIFLFDKRRMEHVITNLLSNAFKFTPEGGTIKASISRHNEYMQLNIKDSGTGIHPEETERIFQRFYQSETGNNRYVEGSGIGLNIVKEYVELHQGTISVESEPGKGSEFIIKLPVNLPREENSGIQPDYAEVKNNFSERATGNEKINQTAAEKETILIVEDNTDLRKYLRSIFQNTYNILEAPNGESGIHIATKENPDIVISDIMMPVYDGYYLVEHLKSQIETCHIPILLLTAKTNEQDKILGYQSGADDYIAKPFNEKELQLKIQNILITRKKYREKFKKSISVNPSEITTTSLDEKFLIKLTTIIESQISNASYSIEQFCKDAGISRRNMHRKLTALTNMNPSQFVRSIRLKRAAQLLEQKSGNVSEIAFQTGFENLSYFSKCFKETFHKLPSEVG